MKADAMGAQVQEQRVYLEKFDGEAPRAGELKEPAEIVDVTDAVHKVIYRKGEGPQQVLYTGIEVNGHSAVCAKIVDRTQEVD